MADGMPGTAESHPTTKLVVVGEASSLTGCNGKFLRAALDSAGMPSENARFVDAALLRNGSDADAYSLFGRTGAGECVSVLAVGEAAYAWFFDRCSSGSATFDIPPPNNTHPERLSFHEEVERALVPEYPRFEGVRRFFSPSRKDGKGRILVYVYPLWSPEFVFDGGGKVDGAMFFKALETLARFHVTPPRFEMRIRDVRTFVKD